MQHSQDVMEQVLHFQAQFPKIAFCGRRQVVATAILFDLQFKAFNAEVGGNASSAPVKEIKATDGRYNLWRRPFPARLLLGD